MRGVALLLCLAACAEFPELDQTATPGVANAAFPDLRPLEVLLAGPVPRTSDEVSGAVGSRVAALDARAARLRGPVVDAGTRRRMDAGVGR